MKVTIVGAGLGGLTLARVLYRNGVEVEIYETDAAAVHRGGTLRLHEESGHAALRAAGVLGHLPAIALESGPARVVDQHGAELPADETGPVVDRSDLRDLLLASLPEDTVHWGERVVETKPGGEIVLTKGRVRPTEALVGADGAGSVVRHLVSDAVPAYSGFSWAEARIGHPAPAGVTVTAGDDRVLLARRQANGTLRVYALVKAPSGGLARKSVLRQFTGWHPDLKALLAGDLTVHPIQVLPAAHRWTRVPGVTLIGDAAHLASPFVADGANLAMRDGAELALAIADHPDDLEQALAAYEEKLFARDTARPRAAVNAV